MKFITIQNRHSIKIEDISEVCISEDKTKIIVTRDGMPTLRFEYAQKTKCQSEFDYVSALLEDRS